MPKMISGIMMGRVAIYSIKELALQRILLMPRAPSVPSTPAQRLLETPSTMLFHSASNMSSSRKRSRYHLRENPPQTLLILLSLKE